MDVGIGLPSTVPATGAAMVLERARRADSASFSSVSVLDRIAYSNYQPLIALVPAEGLKLHDFFRDDPVWRAELGPPGGWRGAAAVGGIAFSWRRYFGRR